jgi:oligosaccharide repeat unit polymerase
MKALAERVENLSSLAVVVSNYEKLAPYEAAYGLENNIMNDLLYGFIPRFLYPDKPEASNPRVYSDLYFNYGENSFTVTPFGDLLRNFGPLGIPLGMFVLGIYFRIVYSSLVETRYPTMWKKMIYYPLLTVVSYESFYATIFPSVIRVIFVTFLAVLLVQFTTRLFASKSFLESRK